MSYYFYSILFIIGLAVGSFLNVVIFRFKPENAIFDLKKINGRSACPYCQKTLRWRELIPLVSFFIQSGKCRSCGHKLSWQYPFVELLSGLVFVAVPYILYPESYAISAVWILILLIFILISVIDFRHFIIPDELVWLLLFLGAAFIFLQTQTPNLDFFNQSFLRHYALLFGWPENIWFNHLFSALVSGVFFGLMFFLGKGKTLGEGDIKLGFALGWLLGWPDTIVALTLSFLIGGVAGFVLMASRKKTMKDFLPLAPFLITGTVLTIFFGYRIVSGYFSLMRI
ncbi:MAG: prepilin peptidase [Patescibacteria group bacterium]